MRLSIRWKVVLFAVVPVATISSALMLLNVLTLRQWTAASVEGWMTEMARNHADRLDGRLREAAQIAAMTASFVETHPRLSSDELYVQLETNLRLNPLLYGSAICFEPFQYDPNQRLFVRYVHRDGDHVRRTDPVTSTGYDYTEERQEYWHIPRDTGKAVWTEPYFDEGGGDILMCTYSVPFFREGRFWGIATIDIPLQPLRELTEIDMSAGFSFTMLTKSGQYVYSPHHERINESAFELLGRDRREEIVRLARAVASGGEGMEKLAGWTAEESEWVFYTPIESAQWGFAASVPERVALSAVQRQFRNALGFVVISLIVVLATLWFLSAQITRPIRRLSRAVAEIARGNLDTKAERSSNDEIGLLADSFNDMALKLSQRDEALRESEQRYRTVVEHTGDFVWQINMDGAITFASAAVSHLYGYEPTELLGKPFHILLNEQSAQKATERLDQRRRGELSDRTLTLELDHRRKDGTEFVAEVRSRPVSDADGRMIGIVGVTRDITERRRAEEALREWNNLYEAASEASGALLYDWNAETGNVMYGGQCEEVIGYGASELDGPLTKWIELIHPEDRSNFEKEIEHLTATRGSCDFECRIRHKNGSYFTAHDTGRFFFDSSGKAVRMVGLVSDITERKRLEEQLRQAQKMEAVGQLAGGIAHDFNNILQGVLGYTEMAQSNLPSDHESYRDMEQVKKGGERAATLTRHLLAFSRRQMIQPVDLDLNDVVTGLSKMLRRVIGEHIELDLRLGFDAGTVHADPGAMQQVLMNLCLNARDAMQSGGRLTLETENVVLDDAFCQTHPWATSGDYTLLSVTDTGTGMPPDVVKRVFEPFFTTKETGKGTGLGLSMVYGLVKQHEGLIHCYSESGKGTCFKIYLPSVERGVETTEKADGGGAPVGGTETILLAEDDRMVRELAVRVLEEYGYRVLVAKDGEESLRLFEEHGEDIELALLDVVMPKVGGREVYDTIRASEPKLPVLFSSGYSTSAIHTGFVVEEGLAAIPKPYSPDDLLRKVREVLDTSK